MNAIGLTPWGSIATQINLDPDPVFVPAVASGSAIAKTVAAVQAANAAAAALVVSRDVVIGTEFANDIGRMKVEGAVASGLQVRADVAGVVFSVRARGNNKCEGRNLALGQAVTFRAE